MKLSSADILAARVKAWRGDNLPARDAAKLFGIPKRTWDNIEQGRGFPYPKLLEIALEATEPKARPMAVDALNEEGR